MRTSTRYFKTFSKMMWMVALLLVVFAAGCDRDHGGVAPGAGGNPGPAGAAPDLGTVAPFGIIAYSAITSGMATDHIYGDVALTDPTSTSSSVTGPVFWDVGGSLPAMPSSGVTNSTGVTPGLVDTTDNGNSAALPQLLLDLKAAYDNLSGRTAPATVLTTPATAAGVDGGTFATGVVNLSGFVLSPGIYATFGGNAGAQTYALDDTAGPLVLDGGGNADAVFIFQARGITTTSGSVILQNGARATNVFWVMTASATIGGSTFFQGTIVAGANITLGTDTNVEGRMLAGALSLSGNGAIVLNGSVISVPAP